VFHDTCDDRWSGGFDADIAETASLIPVGCFRLEAGLDEKRGIIAGALKFESDGLAATQDDAFRD
jgi:hypothetical protein